MEKGYIQSADSIRGIACLAVIFSHLALTFFPALHGLPELSRNNDTQAYQLMIFNSPFSFFYSGGAAVYIFFVLSGIVLSRSYDGGRVNFKNLIPNVMKRYLRLMLPCLASVIICFLYLRIYHADTSKMSLWIDKFGKDEYGFISAIKEGVWGLFFYDGFSIYNWVLWTMRIELAGSISLMLVYVLPKNTQIYVKFFTAALFFIASVERSSEPMYLGIFMFFAGSLISHIKIQMSKALSLVILIAGIYFAGYHYDSYSYNIIASNITPRYSYYSQNLSYALSGLLICLSLTALPWGIISKNKGPLVFLGKISFSLYLVHLIVIYTIGSLVFNKLINKGIGYTNSAILSTILIIITCIIFSTIFYICIDRPAVRISRLILKNRFSGA